jgi:DNA-binding NarL/FixJ family response regulator
MGCKQRSIKDLAQQMGTTQKSVQKQLVDIVEKLRHHDDSIGLWKYLNR